MKIVIIGAGAVGGTLAEHLAREANDITLVDLDEQLLGELQDRLDIRTLPGSGAHPDVLYAAGIEDADMLVAVTSSDEVNMLREFAAAYERVDVLITPEQAVTDYIHRLIERPGALQVLDFAGGRIQLVGMRAEIGGRLVGEELREIQRHIPNIDARAAAIYRRDRSLIPAGDTVIEEGDEVFFIAAARDIRRVMAELAPEAKPYQRIIIAGGGNIGHRLASALEQRLNVKVIEQSPQRGAKLAELLDRAVVLIGRADDRELLLDENIDKTDLFLAVTNDDKANIMSSILAKRLGAGKVMTLISNPVYADLVQGSEIDVAISPQQATTSALLSHVRRGDTVNAHSLRRGAAEALEIIAHGDARNSRVVGRAINEIKLPRGATIPALVRDREVIIAHHDTVIESNDHVIVFILDKRYTRDVEKLFQVGLTFF